MEDLNKLLETLSQLVSIKNLLFKNLPSYNILKYDSLKLIDKFVESIESHADYNIKIEEHLNIILEQ